MPVETGEKLANLKNSQKLSQFLPQIFMCDYVLM